MSSVPAQSLQLQDRTRPVAQLAAGGLHRHQASCPQHQTGLMNSAQMLLPQQLGLFQDERQDGARSEQSSELDCLGAVLTPCDHMDVGLRRAPGCPSKGLRLLFLSAHHGWGTTCLVSSLQTQVVSEAAWGATAVTAEGLPD